MVNDKSLAWPGPLRQIEWCNVRSADGRRDSGGLIVLLEGECGSGVYLLRWHIFSASLPGEQAARSLAGLGGDSVLQKY